MNRRVTMLGLLLACVLVAMPATVLAQNPAADPTPPPGPVYTSLPDGITLRAPSVVKAGQEIDVDATLAEGGILRADAGLHFIIDDVERRMVRTDAEGTASFRLRGVLASGVHQLLVRYNGTRQYYFSQPASATATFEVAPLIITVTTVPSVPGVTIKLDGGRGVVSDANGQAIIGVARAGIHTLAASLPAPDPTSQMSFVRWSDDSWKPSRTIRVVKDVSISVGLRAAYLTPIQFVDLDGNPLDSAQVSGVVVSGPNAEMLQLQYPFPPIWLQTPLPAKHSGEGGLHITAAPYSLSTAYYNRLNVASVGQFRYTPVPGGTWKIRLLLFTLRIGARDAIFGTTLDSPIKLTGPTGRVQILSLDQHGGVTLVLGRGNYAAQVQAAGVTPIATIALSRSQEAIVPVITPTDLTLITFLLLVIMAAVFIAGRGRLWAFGRFAAVRVRYGDRLVQRWERRPVQGWPTQSAVTAAGWPHSARLRPSSTHGQGNAERTNGANGSLELEGLRVLDDGHAVENGPFAATAAVVDANRLLQEPTAKTPIVSSPRGCLLGNEAGMGPITDVGLMIRSLLGSGKAKSLLLLVHQSAIGHWQEELEDKFGLRIPRFEGGHVYSRAGREMAWSGSPWSAFPLMLASSQLARRRDRRTELLAAGPWDVVVVDDAHEARRSGRIPHGAPNKLLGLLQSMKSSHSWKALYLVSDTQAQIRLHEALELLDLVGVKKMPAEAAADLARYFSIPSAQRPEGDWEFLRQMCLEYFTDAEPAARKQPKSAQGAMPRAQRSRRVRRLAVIGTDSSVTAATSSEVEQ